jgi:hypothetical protein
MSQLFAVVLLLADVSGHGLDNIVEQKVAELVEGGDLQPRDKSSSKSVVFYHQLSVGDEVALSAAEGNNKILKLGRFNVANRVMVELLPHFPELVNVQLRNGQTERVGLAQERVDDDGDEKIQEDLGHDHRERIEVDVSY